MNCSSSHEPGELLLNQAPDFDPTEPEPVPEFECNQSVPDEFDA